MSGVRASVVMPTYRRHDLLSRCLEALVVQTFENFEIVVADDANSDDTRRVVEDFAAITQIPIRYVGVTGTHGPAAARNRGWQAASGPFVAFTDDDCLPEPGWLAAGVAALEAGADAVWGKLVMPLPPDPSDYELNAAGLASAEFVTANCFCRRDALAAVGGFDERFTAAWREDSDLHFSLLEHGKTVVHSPEAVVVHPVRPAAWGVSLKQQRKSMFDALLYKKHPELFREKITPQHVWHYYLACAALAAAPATAIAGAPFAALGFAGLWAFATAEFCGRRLKNTSRRPDHVLEMVVTSALIPPLAIAARLRGAWRFRVPFA